MTSARPGTALTEREIRVVSVYLEADDTKAAAYELGISPRAVRAHLHNVKVRTGLTQRELVQLLFPSPKPVKRPRTDVVTLPIWA